MKKIIVVLLVICMLSFTGCDSKSSWYYFDAKVIEVNKDIVLVEITDIDNSYTIGSQAYVQTIMESDYKCPKMEKDDKIRVYYNGEILETAPMGFQFIYDIDIFDEDGNIINE